MHHKYEMMKFQIQAVTKIKPRIMKMVKFEFNLEYLPVLSDMNINNGRYTILKFNEVKRSYAVVFKKQRFHSFGKIFNEIGEGETINKDDFDNELSECKGIFYVYQTIHSLEYYYIEVEELRKLIYQRKAHEYINKADGKKQYAFNFNNLNEIVIV